MESKMSGTKEEKPKTVLLFYISQSLFKNKRLKRRLAGKKSKKTSKKRTKNKTKTVVTNGRPSQSYVPPSLSETIEIISTDEEKEEQTSSIQPGDVETSIVLSSGDEDDNATQARIFPMLTSETTVQTAVGNAVYELSLTQLKENLETITKKKKKKSRGERLSKRLKNNNTSVDLSISLLSDDEEDNNLNKTPASTAAAEV